MSKHWRPQDKVIPIRPVRDGPWTRPEGYGDLETAKPRGIVTVVLGAVLLGLVIASAVSWSGKSLKDAKPDAAIEWNAVQAVTTRSPDAEDVAWQKRAEEPLAAPTAQTAAAASAPSSSPSSQSIYVVDGDTFSMGGERIRISGIDTPETHPPRCMEEARLGLAATEKLRQLLAGGTVTLSGVKHDRYGRDVREVRVNGQDVAQAMISSGLARSYAGEKRQSWCPAS